MSNYKKGDRFVIELEERVGNLWRIKWFNALVFDDFGLDKLSQLVQGVDLFSYNKGAEDAWKLMQEIQFGDFTQKQLTNIFGDCITVAILKENTYAEAAAKLKAWKERNEIHVGDIVTYNQTPNIKGVVLRAEKEMLNVLWENLSYTRAGKDNFKKTDRHIDIEAVLEQIKKHWLQPPKREQHNQIHTCVATDERGRLAICTLP